jgi:putative ABC transport system substrate-binding protein
LNLWRRSLADWDGLLLSLRGLCGERSSGQQAPGRYTWPPRFLLLFSFFLLVLWAGDSSLLAQDSGRAEYKAGKPSRLCFLTLDPRPAQGNRFDPFFQRLRDLGYVDGRTITINYLSADGQGERFPALAAECLQLHADIIVVTTTPAAQAAKAATRTLPIVMLALGDPVGTGLVASLARPGGNMTGQTIMAAGLAAKRLELLKETIPRLSRVLVLSYLEDPIAAPQVKELERAARSVGVKLLVQDIRAADDLPAAFDAGGRWHADGLLTTAESIFVFERTRIVELAARHRLPGLYPYRAVVDSGGLMAYDSFTPDLLGRTATYVDRILKGAKPADLPVEQPTKYELVINLKAAKALGLTIPPSLLARADQVIE